MGKLVIFDWGNVLLDSDTGSHKAQTALHDSFREAGIRDTGLWTRLQHSEGLWTKSGEDLERYLLQFMPRDAAERLPEIWKRNMDRVPWFKETLAVMEKTARLGADAGVRTGILSDCCEWDAPVIIKHAGKYALYCFFQLCSGAHEAGPAGLFPRGKRSRNKPGGYSVFR